MKQYIDKAAIVAEIERLIDSHKPLKTLDPTYCEGLDDSLNDVLSFIDTLKVKEVNLDKEVTSYILDNTRDGYFRADIHDVAEHFYELGIKAQKGE